MRHLPDPQTAEWQGTRARDKAASSRLIAVRSDIRSLHLNEGRQKRIHVQIPEAPVAGRESTAYAGEAVDCTKSTRAGAASS
jgi:hypothetical protein